MWEFLNTNAAALISATALVIVNIALMIFNLKQKSKEHKDTLKKFQEERRERLVFQNYNLRQKSYESLYTALKKYKNYFEPFAYPGNEFIEQGDPQDFAPLKEFELFREEYNKHEMWIHQSTKEKIDELFGSSGSACNFVLVYNSSNYFPEMGSVESIALMVIDQIEEVESQIRIDTGIVELDSYIEEMLSKKNSE